MCGGMFNDKITNYAQRDGSDCHKYDCSNYDFNIHLRNFAKKSCKSIT